MEAEPIKKLLGEVHSGAMSVEEALVKLRRLPYDDIGFAKIDTHRSLRKGFPEVIFCKGKTIDQITQIVQKMHSSGLNIIATKASPQVHQAIKQILPEAVYYEEARMTAVVPEIPRSSKTVLVVTGGTADTPVAEEAAVTAELMGSRVERLYDVGIAGLHRLLSNEEKLFSANVLVAVAGMEGALPSVVGGLVKRPVIAVPTSVGYGASFNGLAALLTMLNCCAPGVAVVNIDNGFGAGYLANLINFMSEEKK
jgi:hypothetical protein